MRAIGSGYDGGGVERAEEGAIPSGAAGIHTFAIGKLQLLSRAILVE